MIVLFQDSNLFSHQAILFSLLNNRRLAEINQKFSLQAVKISFKITFIFTVVLLLYFLNNFYW